MQRLRFVFLVSFVLSVLAAPAMAGTRAVRRPAVQVSAASIWTWVAERIGDLVPAFAQAYGTMDPDGREIASPPQGVPTGATVDTAAPPDSNGAH